MTLKDHLNSPAFGQQIQRALPTGQGGQRLIRAAITSMQRNPKLAESDQNSFFAGLLSLAQMGLCPDGREAHLIPVWNGKSNRQDVLAIPDFKGLVRLAMESGKVSYIHADLVCENDDFVEDRGRIVSHKIDRKNPRGRAYAVYAFAQFKDGSEKAEVMSTDDVEAIRGRSRAKDSGPWVTDWNEMAKKTVFKRLSKWLPLSPEVVDAVEADVAEIDPDVVTTVSAPPAPEARPRLAESLPAEPPKRPRGRPPAPRNVTPPAQEADEIPMDPPSPPPVQAPRVFKATDDQRKVQDWMQAKSLTFADVVGALVEYEVTQAGEQRVQVIDLTPDEVQFLLINGEAVADAIIQSR